jgi:hypothetical protein
MSVPPERRPAYGPGHPGLADVLRTEVWMLRCRTRRRLFAPSAWVRPLSVDGAPLEGPATDLLATTESAPDHALRVDIAVGGLDAAFAALPVAPADDSRRAAHTETTRAALVVVRSGPLEIVEDDGRWHRAWRVACDIVDVGDGGVYVVTRAGWLDVEALAAVRVPRLRAARRGARRAL